MSDPPLTVFFDFVDPISYLLARELRAVEGEPAPVVEWHPCEIRPPPTPLTTVDDPSLAGRWERARATAALMDSAAPAFDVPTLVPWTRKAHELVLHAQDREPGRTDATRSRIFEAYLLEGRDIGRVDVLVDLAVELGFDPTETKAVLDVDTHRTTVAALHAAAKERGVTDVPTLIRGHRRLEGFHNRHALGTFLGTRS